MRNTDIVEKFERVADLLEIRDDNPFRIRAYRNAARTIDGFSRELRDMLEDEEDVSELPDIGDAWNNPKTGGPDMITWICH